MLRAVSPLPAGASCAEVLSAFSADPSLAVLPMRGEAETITLVGRTAFLVRAEGAGADWLAQPLGWQVSPLLVNRAPLSVDAELDLADAAALMAAHAGAMPGLVITRNGAYAGIGLTADLLARLAAIGHGMPATVPAAAAGARLPKISEHHEIGYFRIAADHSWLTASPALARLYGFDSPEALMAGAPGGPHHFAVDPAMPEDFAARIAQDDEVLRLEYQVRRQGGAILWVCENARPIRDGDGTVMYYEGTILDVTERTRYEFHLLREQVLLQATLENIDQGIMMFEPDGRLMAWNRRVAELLDLPADFLETRPTLEAIGCYQAFQGEFLGCDDALAEMTRRWIAPTAEGDESAGAGRQEWPRPDGHVLEVHTNRLSDGGFVRTVTDVTDRKRAEEGLRASEQMLHAVIDAIPAKISVKDLDHRYRLMNRHEADLYDIMPDQAIGRTPGELAGAGLLERDGGNADADLHDLAVIETGEALPFFDECETAPDGGLRHWLSTRVPLKDDSGMVAQIVSVSLEVTGLKRAEAALAQERAFLRATLENMDQAIIMMGRDLQLLGWNLRCVDLLDLPQELLETYPTLDDIARYHAAQGEYREGSADAEEQVQFWANQRAILESWHIYERRRPNGTVIEVRTNRLPGHGYVCTYTDITERKEAEVQALRHREQLRGILDMSPVGVCITAPGGDILWSNARLAALLGGARESLAGTSRSAWFAEPGRYDMLVERFDRQGAVRDHEAELVRSDGSRWWALLTLKPLDYDGQAAVITWVYDITLRRRAEEQLRTAQEGLMQAEKMAALGSLVAGVAHEINTPIGTALTAASHLSERTRQFSALFTEGALKRSDAQSYIRLAEEMAQIISGNIGRAAELIQSFKQVAVDQSSDERRRFDLKGYIDEVLISLRPRLRKTSHQVGVVCADGIEVDSFPGALSQVLTNLLMNALVHAFGADQDGHIAIHATLMPNDEVEIGFRDDGQGIPARHLSRIFDPFFTTKRGAGGTGLGLHIVYNIVTRQLGGSIRCQSTEGRGTIFVIRFPRVANISPVVKGSS